MASLWVGDLASDIIETRLFDIFNAIGPVASVRVCTLLSYICVFMCAPLLCIFSNSCYCVFAFAVIIMIVMIIVILIIVILIMMIITIIIMNNLLIN